MSKVIALVRQNFAENSEQLLNKQINMELSASYAYESMYAYFSRADVALFGFAKLFKKAMEEEREHADNLTDYINMRGGTVVLEDIKKPAQQKFTSALQAVEQAIKLERDVNQSLLALHKEADAQGDAQLCDYIESNFLEEQVKAIKELSDLVTKMNRAGDSVGLHIIDKELQD